MDQKILRKSDFITSIIVMLFGIFVTVMSMQMPMTASYGGVQSLWYVAPSLFPLGIGIGLILLGAVLCYIAIRDGGLRTLVDSLKDKTRKKIDVKQIRVMVIMFAIGSFIYLFIPHIDFVVSISIFLLYVCATFYLENDKVFKYLTRYFIIISLALLILIATGLEDILIAMYPYTLDAAALISLIVMYFYGRSMIKEDKVLVKKLNTALLVAIITPLILCPIFRYPLLTPLPNEGIIIDHMNLIYYAIKY